MWTVLCFKWIKIKFVLYVTQNSSKTNTRSMELFVRFVTIIRKEKTTEVHSSKINNRKSRMLTLTIDT